LLKNAIKRKIRTILHPRCKDYQLHGARASAAARDAETSPSRDPVVLLSPACASFDQYRNFEVRGDAFRALVLGLPGVIARSH
jgi:UDP-N-acetylmuramoylalanine-D-glutamate ligase